MYDILKKRLLAVPLALMLLCAACTAAPVADAAPTADLPAEDSPASEATDEYIEIITLETESDASATAPTLEPVPTPEPTPVPDSPYGIWSDATGTVTLSVSADGTVSLTSAETSCSARGTVNRDSFSFTQADGSTARIGYFLSGDTLTVSQPNQCDIVFNRTAYGDYAAVSDAADEASANPFCLVWTDRAVVTVETDISFSITEYCFTAVNKQPSAGSPDWDDTDGAVFSVYKSDGTFFLWLKDSVGTIYGPREVNVQSGYTYPIKAEGLRSLSISLDGYAKEHGTTAEELTKSIYADIGRAGLYTRQGAVTSGISLVSHMAALGASVTYQGHGSYQGKDDWGVNPQWGAKLKNPTSDGNGTYYYTGMQCVAAIVWAYKQAGINLSNEAGSAIGTLGETVKKGDNTIRYDEARSGDIVKQNGHYLMVVDRLDTNRDGEDDTYLTYEMNAPHLTCLKLTFKQVRYREFFSMDGVFTNEGRRKDKARFWENTFFIPEESLPAELYAAMEAGSLARACARIAAVLGGAR